MFFVFALGLSLKPQEKTEFYINEIEQLRIAVHDLKQQVKYLIKESEMLQQEQIYHDQANAIHKPPAISRMPLQPQYQQYRGSYFDYYPGEEENYVFKPAEGMDMLSVRDKLQFYSLLNGRNQRFTKPETKTMYNGKQPRPILEPIDEQYDVLY